MGTAPIHAYESRAAYIARDEIHSKGSDSGMSALMLQLAGFELRPR